MVRIRYRGMYSSGRRRISFRAAQTTYPPLLRGGPWMWR